jgi:protein-tyrosine phosphatase
MPLVFKVINFPYLAYTWVIWNLWRCVCREDAFNEISAELAVGRRLLASELSHDFDYYVDLTSEFEEPKKIRVHTGYRCLPVLDTRCPSHGELAGLLKEVSRGKTFVHCAQGHGRTGLFAAALLLYSGRATSADEALAALKKIRPSIGLSAEQQSFLKKWELDTVSSLDTPLCQFDRSQVSKQPRMIRSSPPSP